MKKIALLLFLLAALAGRASADTALDSFMAEANASLMAHFGFGATNIPVYSATNPAVAYNSSVHYYLQAAANDYDATTPSTAPASAFRPTFGWVSNTLYIVGYACVSTNSYAQIAKGFKDPTDLSIAADDNVWGIPWVIGKKGDVPVFNEFCCANQVYFSRTLQFIRYPSPQPGKFDANRPPQFTNQFYMMSMSNALGLEMWNYSSAPFTNPVQIILADEMTVTITNNYDYGSNARTWITTNMVISNFAGFKTPLSLSLPSLPFSYWSESRRALVPTGNGVFNPLPGDTNQMGFPTHRWTFSVTNKFTCLEVDATTGRVLDFVNPGLMGSLIDMAQALSNAPASPFNMWSIPPSTDSPNSLPSTGMMNQIIYGYQLSQQFFDSMMGAPGGYPNTIRIFTIPVTLPNPASQILIQYSSWHAANPLVHSVAADLIDPNHGQLLQFESLPQAGMPISLVNSVCTLGRLNPDYNAGIPKIQSFGVSGNAFDMEFTGVADLPYVVWASSNLLDWKRLGTPDQPVPGQFLFDECLTSNRDNRFYQIRLP